VAGHICEAVQAGMRSAWSESPVVRILAALLLGLAAALANGASDSGTVSTVRRSTLVVHDMDAAVRFYRDVLGFEVWLQNTGTVGPSSLPSEAPPGSTSRFTIMKGRHPWVGMIGLLQYGDARPLPGRPDKLGPGDVVLMIETEDLEGAWRRMQTAGTPILRPPQTTEVTGAGGAKWLASFVFAFDPDGHLIELNQRHPAGSAGAAAPSGAVRVRRGFVDTRLGQLHYRRAEPLAAQGQHTPLVLLHQTPLSGRMFSDFLGEAASDRVVYAPDTAGYGESAQPATRPTLEEYADALDDFLQTVGEPVDLLGYHTGAAIAVAIARRHPSRVRRLTLVSVPLLNDEQKERFRQPAATLPLRTDGSHLIEMWQSTMSARPEGQSLEQAARIVAEKQRNPTHTEWALAALADYPLATELPGLTQPVLILRPKDGLWEQTAQAAALVPGATLLSREDWTYGIFDAHGAAIAAALRSFTVPGLRVRVPPTTSD
jgi:pimeloyl-ACP methyl ester carboxylesterase/catechol 2,3-dioxygenase-like lactoylglutathione lyase family enzyme